MPGFTGDLLVEYAMLGGSTAYDPRRVAYLRVNGYVWAWYAAASDGPWAKSVKAPSGSTKWCLKIPFKATTGEVDDWSVEVRCLSLQSPSATDNKGYYSMSDTAAKRVFSSSDGYLYVEMFGEKPNNAPIALWFDATIPAVSPA